MLVYLQQLFFHFLPQSKISNKYFIFLLKSILPLFFQTIHLVHGYERYGQFYHHFLLHNFHLLYYYLLLFSQSLWLVSLLKLETIMGFVWAVFIKYLHNILVNRLRILLCRFLINFYSTIFVWHRQQMKNNMVLPIACCLSFYIFLHLLIFVSSMADRCIAIHFFSFCQSLWQDLTLNFNKPVFICFF